MKFQLNSAVYDDLREIMEYYDEAADGETSNRFYDEFRHCADRAAAAPKSHAVYMDGPDKIRRVNLKRFPYRDR
jgi:hypothetical protein